MLKKPKTIQFFLPSGDPQGIKIVEFTNRIPLAIFLPRNKINDISERPEIRYAGVYFLFGDDDEVQPPMYIGEAEDPLTRIRQHHADKKKGFWKNAVIFVSKTNHFTKSHVKYLEWLACNRSNSAGRYKIENGNTPNKPYVTEPLEADLQETFDTIETLLSVLGYPALEKPKVENHVLHYYCGTKGSKAKGEPTSNGFMVFKDSTAVITETPTISASTTALRKKLLQAGIFKEEGKFLKFTKDHIFSSPSQASCTCLGRRSNGWTEWKNEKNQSLNDTHR